MKTTYQDGLISALLAIGIFSAIGFLAASHRTDAGTTGSVALQGVVNTNCDLAVSTNSNGTTLNLTTSQAGLVVATVNENCNDRAGYTVALATLNGNSAGLLKGTGISDSLSYTVQYGGAPVAFSTGAATVTNAGTRTAPTGVNNNIAISYSGNPNLLNDIYTDMLSLTLTTR